MLRSTCSPSQWFTGLFAAAFAAVPAFAAPLAGGPEFSETPGTAAAWATLTGAPSSQSNPSPATGNPPPALNEPAPAGTSPAPGTPGATAAPSTAASEPEQTFTLGGGYLHQFGADIDGPGTMSADRFYAGLTSRLLAVDNFKLTLAMGYEYDWYHWQGVSSLGTATPFDGVNLFALQLRATYRLSSYWMVGVGGVFGLAGESDADAGDSLYGGGIASVAWTPREDLMLGIGVLAVTQIEDDVLIIPIPLVHWKITEEWTLSTIRRPPASPFVGLDLAWEPTGSPLDVSIGVAWQTRRFRLGTNPVASLNKGVGEDQSWALLGMIGYDINKSVRLDFLVGVNFYEQLVLENSVGKAQRSATMDPSAMLGAFLTLKF